MSPTPKTPPSAPPRRFRRIAVATALLAALGAILWWRSHSVSPPADPTKVGPERTLTIDAFRIDPASPTGGYRLQGSGKTNFPDGVLVRVELLGTDVVASVVATVAKGAIAVDVTDPRIVTNGTYRVFATFRIEDQSIAIRDALVYQPKRLQATSSFVVTNAVPPETSLRPELLAMIRAAHAATSRAELGKIASDAATFEKKLWISTLTPSVRRLRLAVVAALEAPSPDFTKLKRGALEAEALSSL
jgi:hypothetical protein